MTDSFLSRFSGISRLYGEAALARFRHSHVAIIGIGGVGSWTAEALARSGIGCLTLVDLDDLCVTNTNRQIHALHNTVGKSKTEVMTERLLSINPEMTVHNRQQFYTEANSAELLSEPFDAVVDAIDSMRSKCHLLDQCRELGLPVVTSGGAGGRMDVTQVKVADLSKTHGCALLLQVRRNLRNYHRFPSGENGKGSKFGISAVFSSEPPRYPSGDGCISTQRPEQMPAGMRCDAGYGSATHLTATFGFAIAGEILRILANKKDD